MSNPREVPPLSQPTAPSSPLSLITHVVPRNDVSRIKKFIDVGAETDIQEYINRCYNHGMTILHQAALCKADSTMVCLIEKTENSYRYRVIGFPVIHSSAYSNKNVHLKLSTSQGCSSRRFGVASLHSITFDSSSNNANVVVDFNTALNCSSVSSLDEDSYGDIVLCNEDPEETWSSLRIMRRRNNAEVAATVLDMFPDEETRKEFIKSADIQGMTFLHWAAHCDNPDIIDAALDRLSLDDKNEMVQAQDQSGWTVLHATAYKGAAKVMRSLQDKFADETNIKWNMLKCTTENGKTPLHIAVAEKNVKVAIMLVDFADDMSLDLLNAEDESGKTVLDYTAVESLLGGYFRLAKDKGINNVTVLHGAAEADDGRTLELIFDNFPPEEVMDMCLQKTNGETVFHTACSNNSLKFLSSLCRHLHEEKLLDCMELENQHGETALHVACRSNNPKTIRMILKSIRHSKWNSLLNTKNKSGHSLMDVAEECVGTKDVLKYHQLLASEGPEEFFLKMDYGLFQIKLSDKDRDNRYKNMENHRSDEPGFMRFMNYDSVVCLGKNELQRAQHRIDTALECDGENIHTVCNKGRLLALQNPGDLSQAEELAFKALEILSEKDVRRMTAKIDYAYWSAEADRANDALVSSCGVFEQCLVESLEYSGADQVRAMCAHYYSKTLVRMMRNKEIKREKIWYESMINKVIHLFLLLANADPVLYRGDLWLWIAELQCQTIRIAVPDILEKGLKLLKESNPALFSTTTPESCLNNALGLQDNYANKTKFLMRIGKICLDRAYDVDDWNQCKYWCQEAIKSCEMVNGTDDNQYFMCRSTIAKASIRLWEIEYYDTNKQMILERIQQRTAKRFDVKDYRRIWSFLSAEYYCITLRQDPITTEHLGKAKRHLEELVNEQADGWMIYGHILCRLRYMLGDPIDIVFNGLETALARANLNKHKLTILQNFGLFYEILGPRYDPGMHNALDYHERAIALSNQNDDFPRPSISYNGIRAIKKNKY